MKIKYECEADENGYTERVIVDGVVKYQTVNERTDTGTKQVSGDDMDDSEDEVINALYDEFPAFLGMNLCRIVEDLQ